MRRWLSWLGALPGLACIVLVAAFFAGPALYIEVAGASADGEVVAKREEIKSKSESWARQLTLDVRYRPADAEEDEVAQIAVDAATYDQQRVGAAVRVRYLPDNEALRQLGNAIGARLETQPPLGSFVVRFSSLAPYVIGVALWLAFLWAWVKWRRWWFGAGILAVMVVGAFLGGSGWQRPLPSGDLVAGSATVRQATRIDRVWGGRRTPAEDAAQPFLVVELEFVPPGRADPVVAVDLVDDGSVSALEKGADVPIHYSAADPRRAQIDGATRTYYWKNLRGIGLAILVALVTVMLSIAWGRWRRARRARRAGA